MTVATTQCNTRETAIAAWNTRVAAPQATPDGEMVERYTLEEIAAAHRTELRAKGYEENYINDEMRGIRQYLTKRGMGERVTISDHGMRVHVCLDGKSVATFNDSSIRSAMKSAEIYARGLRAELNQEGRE